MKPKSTKPLTLNTETVRNLKTPRIKSHIKAGEYTKPISACAIETAC